MVFAPLKVEPSSGDITGFFTINPGQVWVSFAALLALWVAVAAYLTYPVYSVLGLQSVLMFASSSEEYFDASSSSGLLKRYSKTLSEVLPGFSGSLGFSGLSVLFESSGLSLSPGSPVSLSEFPGSPVSSPLSESPEALASFSSPLPSESPVSFEATGIVAVNVSPSSFSLNSNLKLGGTISVSSFSNTTSNSPISLCSTFKDSFDCA